MIPNPRLCKALLDRITDRAHIIETGTSPLRVAPIALLDDDAPSIQSHYRTFFSTANVPAPMFRIGTLTVAKAICLSFSLVIGTTGSCFPHSSPDQARAALMPDAG